MMSSGALVILTKLDCDLYSINFLQKSIERLGCPSEKQVHENLGINEYIFENSSEDIVNLISREIKVLAKESGTAFFRALYSDDYGREIMWLCKDGKGKKFEHDQDSEGVNIVKAYREWASGIGDLWFGSFSREEIDIMSERFGQFDENGKKVKKALVDFSGALTKGKEFFSEGVRAPFASEKWDYHIPVFESFARLYVDKSGVALDDGIQFLRTYYFPNHLGYVWLGRCSEGEVFVFLMLLGDLGVSANIVFNRDGFSQDHVIIINKYLLSDQRRGGGYDFESHFKVINPFEFCKFMHPCIDYLIQGLPDGIRLLRDEYNFHGMTINVNFFLERDGECFVCSGYTSSGKKVRLEILDKEMIDNFNKISTDDYFDKEFYDLESKSGLLKKVLYAEMQASFDLDFNILKVHKCKISGFLKDASGSDVEKVLFQFHG